MIAILVALGVLSSLSPLLQGCGEDLLIPGDLVIPTANPSSNATAMPTETPDPIDF